MNKIDSLRLDSYTLRTFITLQDESSVSKAAIRLRVNQSAVSHTLDRLRLALDEALFVRVGRGIVPTAKVASLREPVEAIISELKSLAVPMVDMIRFHAIQSDRRVQRCKEHWAKALYPL